MSIIETKVLGPSDAEISICARWRAGEFADVLGTSVAEEEQALRKLATDQSQQVALIATCDGHPAGTCLLVTSEIDPLHDVSPWLAGLYVAPEFRRIGVGRALVSAIEEWARLKSIPRIYLYTDDREVSYYRNLGWNAVDRVDWKGFPTNLMVRVLGL
ncbi:MAG: GNAT family N-acetyltransferase [Hyphomicrobiales bacterium]